MAAKLSEIRERQEPHTVAMISGRTNDLTARLAGRFMEAYGSPNLIGMPTLKVSKSLAENAQFGKTDSIGYDLENSKYILSFGCGLIEGWGSPVRSIKAFSSWRGDKKAKLVQIDNQATLTASKADEWIAVIPGTEGALALGLAQVMVEKGLYDKDFVAENCFGFDEFAAVLAKDYTTKEVSAITGVSAEVIVKLAEEFAAAEGAVALSGKGTGAMPTPVYELMSVMALNALKGNINKKGGVIVRKDLPLKEWPEFQLDSVAEDGNSAPRLDLAQTAKYRLTGSILSEFVESVNSGRFYPVSMLILDRANPDYFGADPGAFRRALDKIPLVVSLSNMADDSSIHADIILPDTSNYEGPVDVINPPDLPYPLFGAAEAVIDKTPFDCRPAADTLIALAQEIGGSVAEAMPFNSHGEMIKYSAEGLAESGRGKVVDPEGDVPGWEFAAEIEVSEYGETEEFMAALRTGLFWYDPAFEYGDLAGAFDTPSQKFEFVSQNLMTALNDFIKDHGERDALTALGVTKGIEQLGIPHFESYMPEGHESKFPLLMVPAEQFKLVTDYKGNAPYLTKLLEDTTLKKNNLVVHINPHTAEDLHLKDGDLAWLRTAKGRQDVQVFLFEGARPGVVYAPIGLGHSGFGIYLRGKGVNPMQICQKATDPLSGQELWWGTPASLIKV